MIRCDGSAKDGSGRWAQLYLPVTSAAAATAVINQAAVEFRELDGMVNVCGERMVPAASPAEFDWTYTTV